MELVTERGSIRPTPVRVDRRSIVAVDGGPILANGDGHTITDDDVQGLRHADHR